MFFFSVKIVINKGIFRVYPTLYAKIRPISEKVVSSMEIKFKFIED